METKTRHSKGMKKHIRRRKMYENHVLHGIGKRRIRAIKWLIDKKLPIPVTSSSDRSRVQSLTPPQRSQRSWLY